MIEREITPCLVKLFEQYPFVTVTGPRQSGKTTLCRAAFPHLKYVNLEAPDQREFAESDPRGFLSQLGVGAILDEIQRVPELLSYLQVLADEKGQNSLFVLTGSEQFKLSDAISQSLAGRTALLHLLPFSLAERQQTGTRTAADDILYSGFYPRIHDQGLDPRQALGDYFETYVERDVRGLSEIRNLSTFRRFVCLCAGRVGQLVNLSSLGADAGVSHTTARHWLTTLEASYIIFQLPPFHANIRKRLVKAPKLYFYDVGLASYLIGIEQADQMATHPLRGVLFENVVVAETLKHRFNRGHRFNLSFFRDRRGLECDLLYETGHGIAAIEIKSGATIASDYFDGLSRIAELVPQINAKTLVYGGTDRQSRSDCEVVPIDALPEVLECFEQQEKVQIMTKQFSWNDKLVAYDSEEEIKILDGPTIFLNLWSGKAGARFKNVETMGFVRQALDPMAANRPEGRNRNFARHRNGAVAYTFDNNDPLTARTASALTRSGEIYGIDRYLLQHDKTARPYVPTEAIEKILIDGLGNFLDVAKNRLKLSMPLEVDVGLEGIQGFRLAVDRRIFGDEFIGPILDDTIVQRFTIEDYDCDPSQLLLPLFEEIYDKAGHIRPRDVR